MLFNLRVLLFCEKDLKDRKVADVISYGMELDPIERLVKKPGALEEACDEIDQMIDRLLRTRRKVA